MLEWLIDPWVLVAEGKIVEVKNEEIPEVARVGDEIMTSQGRGQIVALGADIPDAKLISLIDRRPPKQGYEELVGKNQQKIDELKAQMKRADVDNKELKKLQNALLELLNQRGRTLARIYKQGEKEYEVGQEYTPRNPAEAPEIIGKQEYEQFVREWQEYQLQLQQRRYQGMKNHPQGTDLGDWERYQQYMAERGRAALGEPMRFGEWTKLSREKPSAYKRKPGENLVVKGEWGNFKSKVYGHAVIEHGVRRLASELQDRSRSTGKPQGHWNNDQLIIEAEQLTPLLPGEHVINMDKPCGNVYLPDSTTLEGVMIVKIIRSKDLTLKTAYPFC